MLAANTPLASRSWFVGIGIDNYEHYPRPLDNPARDVRAISELLGERFGFDEVHLLLDTEATLLAVVNLLTGLSQRVYPEDSLVLYYAGHGLPGQNDKGFWVPVDGNPEVETSLIPNSTVIDKLDNINARHLLLLCDSCFSGTLLNTDPKRDGILRSNRVLSKFKSRFVICSGTADQLVSDGILGGHSPFAKALLEVLGDPRYPELNYDDLVFLLRSRLARERDQTLYTGRLTGLGDNNGHLVFAVSGEEEIFWRDVLREDTIEAFSRYLSLYPAGKYHALAASIVAEQPAKAATAVQVIERRDFHKAVGVVEPNLDRYGKKWFIPAKDYPAVNESAYTWSAANHRVPPGYLLPTASVIAELESDFHHHRSEMEAAFNFEYDGFADYRGNRTGKGYLQCFWTAGTSHDYNAFAWIFNRDMGKVYLRQLDRDCVMPVLYVAGPIIG